MPEIGEVRRGDKIVPVAKQRIDKIVETRWSGRPQKYMKPF